MALTKLLWINYDRVLGDYMGDREAIVVTAYGHDKILDKIAVSLFEISGYGYYNKQSLDAETYCNAINSVELKNDSWIFARILSENTQYSLDVFLPLKFSDVIMKLDNEASQKVLKEVDAQELAKCLKDQDETVKEKIFTNMSKRAAQMLKEDMDYMGPIRIKDVKESQEKILSIIRHFEQLGEIIISYHKGETTE
jgi:flagellar motor switch protein FliG